MSCLAKTTLATAALSAAVLPTLYAGAAQAKSTEPAAQLPPTTVYARSSLLTTPQQANTNGLHAAQYSDVAGAAEANTGVATIRHGGQTGIVQVNGLAQERVKVLVDGIAITPACPNHMDPPLHYASAHFGARLQAYTGLTPISLTGDSLGNAVSITPKALTFGDSKTLAQAGSLALDYNAGYERTGVALDQALYNDSLSLALEAAGQQADGLVSAKGDVALTEFDKREALLRAGVKLGAASTLELGVGKSASRDTGTPALGMDMIEDDTNKMSVKYKTSFANSELQAGVYYHDIDHVMDNFTLRYKTPTNMNMRADASSRDAGGNIAYTLLGDGGYTSVGAELHTQAFDVIQRNVTMGMARDLIPDATRNRAGVFVEHEQRVTPKFSRMLGARIDYIDLSSDAIGNSMMPDMALKNAFNAASRNKSYAHVDALVAGTAHISDATALTLGLSRNTRAPNMIETYLWRPSKTYAQGDGKAYVGNLDLDPEISHKLSLGLDYQKPLASGRLSSQTQVYGQQIDDFIQGVAMPNNPQVLKFTNTKAELFGVNQRIHVPLNQHLTLDGGISYVRGKNTKLNDNLYRIAPLSGNAKLTYTATIPHLWSLAAEVVAADKQDKVASYNDEKPSAGYAVLNLTAAAKPLSWLEVGVGVNNVFDKYYAPHLAGVNLVDSTMYGGHLAAGEKLPAEGRSGFGFAKVSW